MLFASFPSVVGRRRRRQKMRTYFVRYSSSFGKKRQRIYKLRNAGQTASVYVILHGGANISYSDNLFSTRWLAKSSNRNFVHHKRAHHLRCALRQFILEKLCLCVTWVNLLSWNFHKILVIRKIRQFECLSPSFEEEKNENHSSNL